MPEMATILKSRFGDCTVLSREEFEKTWSDAAREAAIEAKRTDAGGAKVLNDAVSKAHEDISNHLSGLEDKASELDSAHGDLSGTEDELGEGEEYEDPKDQADYEKRYDKASEGAASHAVAARDKLKALIEAAQGHLDKINKHIDEHVY